MDRHFDFQFLMKKYNLTPRKKAQEDEEDYGISAQQMMQGHLL